MIFTISISLVSFLIGLIYGRYYFPKTFKQTLEGTITVVEETAKEAEVKRWIEDINNDPEIKEATLKNLNSAIIRGLEENSKKIVAYNLRKNMIQRGGELWANFNQPYVDKFLEEK